MPENLEDNFQFSYQRLLSFLGKGKEGYIFCRADDLRFVPKINNTLLHDLEKTGVRVVVINLDQDSDEPLLYQMEQAALHADALIVANLYEIVNRSETGRNNLTELNFAREAIWEVHRPVLFWADGESMNIIANHAPDLFSQRRHTTVHFTSMAAAPVAEKLQKDGRDTSLSSEQFKNIQTDIGILKNRLQRAKGVGYPVFRAVNEIVLPLAKNYATLGLKDEAWELIKEYEEVLKTTNDPAMLRQIADVYYGLHEYENAIRAWKNH